MKKTALSWMVLLMIGSLASALDAAAKLRVVTTLPSFGDIAQAVGGDEVTVVSLTKGTQDPHFVDAKPELVLTLNKADLLVRAGLGLEDGWLPPLLTGSRNSKIQVGAPGNLDASGLMELRDVPKSADRAQGDVHPGGNPHYMLDPRNGIVMAKGIASRLAALDPGKAGYYEKRAAKYVGELESRIRDWKAELKGLQGRKVVTYHKSWIYFSAWAGLDEVGTVEPKPGIPPSPSHVVALIGLMREKKVGLILMEPFYPKDSAERVAEETGAKLLVLPSEVHGAPEAGSYIGMFDLLVRRLKAS